MKNNLTRRKKRLIRERTLHRIREARRISRLDVIYDPDKVSLEHRPHVNRKFRKVEPTRGRKVLSFPRKMDFRENLEVTLNFFSDLSNELLYGAHSEVYLEHKDLEKITPEAAIILFAELQRCKAYKATAKRIRGNYPGNSDVANILTNIGFYSSLNIRPPPNASREISRSFFKVIPGNKTDARTANRLIKHFEKVVTFDPIARKRLIASLIECMDNVHNHAYRKDKGSPELVGEWWMAGFNDMAVGQVAFIFFDQGVGVPTTLRERWAIKIRQLIGKNDGELIGHAVLKGITRRNSERHGNGFPSFKEFINEIPDEAGGFLRVISNHGDYSYCKHSRSKPAMNSQPLSGSLMIWSIQPEKETMGQDGRIDLSVEGQQTRLTL
ncbi:MAG: hypothetical protein RPU39_00320 [Candidatus Sedimenticola sp. (ex Thyasira tokunagai)]